jgi:DNA-binding Lrp family transcriptional regulator
MNKNIDDKIVELIEKNEKISNSEISRIIGIPEKEVERRIRGFSDARQKIMISFMINIILTSKNG